MADEVKVKSLEKAMKVLECFTNQAPELGITQISEMLGLNKSNVHNIISTFERLGYIERNANTGKYFLGLKILEYTYVINEHLGYISRLYQIFRSICDKTNQVVFFAVPKQESIIYLTAVYPEQSMNDYPVRLITGEKAPMYCTAIGKAVLAYMEPEDAEPCIVGPKTRFTDHTIVDTDGLRRELALTRKRGYSIDNKEHELEVKCVGVPVFNASGELIAGVSVSGASITFTQEKIEQFSVVLKEAAYQMRERL